MGRTQPEMTDDGRYIIVNGRRWRASDPNIPAELREELVRELMRARRAIKGRDYSARARVHAAKTALGERGEPWWEPTDEGLRTRAVAATRTLLAGRRGEPVRISETAQVVGGEAWQDTLASVEDAVRAEHQEQKWVLQDDGTELRIVPGEGIEL